MIGLAAMPLTRDKANAYIAEHHRHHKRVAGHRFIVGAELDGKLVGVAIAGRPNARMIDQYRHIEVTRLCSAGERNVCSFLYSRVSRIVRELGFSSCFTAILQSETGASLKAAGWVYVYTTSGGSWHRAPRPRVDKASTEPKKIWAPRWCAAVVADLNTSDRLHVAEEFTASERRSEEVKGGT